jgi:hypothetical protein
LSSTVLYFIATFGALLTGAMVVCNVTLRNHIAAEEWFERKVVPRSSNAVRAVRPSAVIGWLFVKFQKARASKGSRRKSPPLPKQTTQSD